MPLSDFFMKKLGKMISDPDYDLNERYAPRLLDADFIKPERKAYLCGVTRRRMTLFCSYYVVTELGEQAYKKWKKEKAVEK